MTIKTYLVRNTAAVDSIIYFEKGFPLKHSMVYIIFHSKTFESEKNSCMNRFSDFCGLTENLCGVRSARGTCQELF